MASTSDTIPYQATGVAIAGRGLLIVGPPGSGKSSLALALLDRGAVLVGDDGVLLETRDGHLWAMPPPALAGLMEVRNVGIIRRPCVEAPVCLVVRLDDQAPRYVERPDTICLAGCIVPLISLWPGAMALHLRAELALELHGTC